MFSHSSSTITYLSIASSLIPLAYLLWLYAKARKLKPKIAPTEIVFQEWFASGCSQKNFLTKIGGARNCLRLVVTKKILWVTSWFPFSLLSPFYDMEHVIPLENIISIRPTKFLGRKTYLLSYRDANGAEHQLRLLPKQPDVFIQSLGVKLDP
jgi:hypothetical protein